MFGIFLPPDMPLGIVAEAVLLVGACFIVFETGLFVRRWQRKRRQKGLFAEAKVVLDSEEQRDGWNGRRRSIRRRLKLVEVLVDAPNLPHRPVRGYVINRSHGGLLLGLAESVAVGEILKVRPHQAPADVPWIALKVLYCSKLKKKFWRVGAQYQEDMPVGTRLLFG